MSKIKKFRDWFASFESRDLSPIVCSSSDFNLDFYSENFDKCIVVNESGNIFNRKVEREIYGIDNVSRIYDHLVPTTNNATGNVSWKTLDAIKDAMNSDNPHMIINAIDIPIPESIILFPKLLDEFAAENLIADTSKTVGNEFVDSYNRRCGLVYSMKGSLTSSHIDFGCANYFHIITGEKLWAVSLFTEENMALFSNCDINNLSFHPSERLPERTYLFRLKPGDTLFMPAGAIHTVYTEKTTEGFGSTLLPVIGGSIILRVMQTDGFSS
ncbi:lysine-specific demethylase 7B-like protein [Dinothrombium tinctorium]|uniref:Lysine-specific demethylase 7B-like protein n=1 Tax=Dinothrombium tinctorium TaxID=1965070 RepID=A0A3S3NW06_9ACAR|nr:lysine-specific demethylase 7B-like protein [Dinothrombium tinctorium]